ncbi:MAG: fibronectin type III domain-containing protein, partial [Thermoleophilia bacterium]|nr:fibronectin type III domain-containing protein [Thermoleophilia bacterium]
MVVVALLLLGLLVLPQVALAGMRPAMPRHGWVTGATTTSVTVRWLKVPGAVTYDVRVGGRRVGTVRATSARVNGLAPASFANVQVVARRGRLASVPSDPIPAVTRASGACTRWVSSTRGSDAGAGTQASPWRTIGKLVGGWQAGDVGCVEGTFVEDVSIFRGGDSARTPVTLPSAPGTRASLR